MSDVKLLAQKKRFTEMLSDDKVVVLTADGLGNPADATELVDALGLTESASTKPTDYKRLGEFAAAVKAGTLPRVAVFGDSISTWPREAFEARWGQGIKRAAVGVASMTVSDPSVVNLDEATAYGYWFEPIIVSIPAGEEADSKTQVSGDTLIVEYIKFNGGGTFKVQSSSDNGSSWQDEAGHTAIDTQNATNSAGRIKISKTSANWRVKVVNTDGADPVYITRLAIADSSGMEYILCSEGGTELSDISGITQDAIDGIIGELDPHLCIFNFLETDPVTADWQAFVAKIQAGAPNASLVFFGPHPTEADPSPTTYSEMDTLWEAVAQNNGVAFFPLRQNFPTWSSSGEYWVGAVGPEAHLNAVGDAFKNAQIWEALNTAIDWPANRQGLDTEFDSLSADVTALTDQRQLAVLATDFAKPNDATLGVIPSWSVNVAATGRHLLRITARLSSNNTAGFQGRLNFGTITISGTEGWWTITKYGSPAVIHSISLATGLGTAFSSLNFDASGNGRSALLEIWAAFNVSNIGNQAIQFEFAQSVSNGFSTTLLDGATMELIRE